MTTSHGSDQGSQGSSRYDDSPVGGLGEESRTQPKHGGGGYGQTKPDAPAPGYEPEAPQSGDEPETPPPGYEPETPDPGYEPETPDPETPEGGYGPEDPGYEPGGGTPEPPTDPPTTTHPCPPSMTCDTRGIDDLQCEAMGVKAESDALAAVATALAARRAAFETARGAYTQARDAATQSVKELNRKADDLLDDTRCLLNRDEVECIDKAFGQVLDCLEECPDEQGCCVDEGCGFEDQTWTVGQMDDLRVRVERVEKCFDDVLVAEPAALTARVAALQALVDELVEALKADPREDASRLYARAKRARWLLDRIWGRFTDVNEFQNCLCCGLTCSLRGRQWLAQLAGKKAYQDCQDASRTRRCQWLRDNLVDETLATQLILCPPGPPCGEEPVSSGSIKESPS